MKTRKAAAAGVFYPDSRKETEEMVDNFLNNASVKIEKEPKALIVPHAGYVYSGQVAAYAYTLLKRFKGKKQKIILLGPSHFIYFNGVAADVNDYWETPLGKVKVAENDFPKMEAAHMNEHCLEVQLPFLQKVLGNFEVLPLVAGDISPKELSRKLISTESHSLLIISSDLSHYNSYESAVKIDKNTINAIKNADFGKMEAQGDACGKVPILAVIDIANKLKWKGILLDYKNSGDTSGHKDKVVGYASFAFYE